MIEPRTTVDIVRDLLRMLQEHEWVEIREVSGCNCCRDTWEVQCTSCEAPEGHYGNENYRRHQPDCALASLIREAEAFLRVEDQLAEERELQGATA